MAELYSNIGAKQNDPTPKNMASNVELTPNTKLLNPVYTLTGDELTGDRIWLQKVPAGTTVFTGRSKVRGDAVATAITINVGYYDEGGDTVDADGFATLLDVAAAGEDAFDVLTQYTFVTEGWITATIAGTLTTPVAGKKLQFEIVANLPN